MALNVTPQQQETIAALYAAFWNRAPDSEGFGNYCTLLASGTMTAEQIATEMRLSAEGRAAYPLWSTNAELVTEVYQNLFDRAPDASGFAAWLNWLNTNNNFPALVVAMANAALNADGIDGQLFDNKIEVGIYVATVLESNNALVTTTAFQGLTYETSSVAEVEARLYEIQNTYTLTTDPDTATAVNFYGPKAYTPGGTDLVNTLQNEDVLTGDTSGPTGTYLYADLGNPNDSGGDIIAPSITDVETIDIAFTTTKSAMTLDFQDISGTTEANMVRISADLRQSFTNMDGEEVLTLGIADTSETAKATFTYLNNSLAADNNEIDVNLDNVSLAYAEPGDGTAALKINATTARGSELQHQVEVFNINTVGGASTVATFSTGVSSFDDLVVGERPQTININAEAALSIGTLRWLGNRVETRDANPFLIDSHDVGVNGLGFTDYSQINAINVQGTDDVTLANLGTWETEADTLGNIDFTLDATGYEGNLTADITNVAGSVDAVVLGGDGSDRFYVAGNASSVSVLAEVSGGAGVDSLTVQSNAGATVNLLTDSELMDNLNLVAAAGVGAQTWTTDLTDGGFTGLTFNNQDFSYAMNNTIENLNGQTLSVRSTGYDSADDPATTATGAVSITFTQAAAVEGGTIDLELGHASDDRAATDALSWENHSSTITLLDAGTEGANEADSLNLVVNTAGASGTGAVQINVNNGDFETSTTLTSDIDADNAVTIGQAIATGSSDYSTVGTNALNSTTYDGSAYLGDQSVTFGDATTYTSTVGKSFDITTGEGDDRVDLSFMTTSAANTTAGYNLSSWLLNTDIVMGSGDDELVLSATLADPRAVVSPDPTYDGYFQNWTGIEELTINNRNLINSARVNLDAYAQINNANLDLINFVDVSGTLDVGFRFTNDLTVTVDACAASGTGVQTSKTTTIISQSESDLTLEVDESYGLLSTTPAGNLLAFTSTGARLGNNVTVNLNAISSAGITLDSNSLAVTAGSLDTVDFDGNIGANAAGTATAGGTVYVTTANTWTADAETTTYDFTGIVNTAGTSLGTVSFTAAAEGADADVIGLTIYGSTDGGSATVGVNNTITGSADNDTITSAGYQDTIDGGAGADTITYTGSDGVASNAVTITGGTGADTITVSNMVAAEAASVNAGAGNDTITFGSEVDTFTFASDATVAITADTATVSQVQNNVGSDTISSWSVGTGDGTLNLYRAVFGTNIGVAGALASTKYDEVATSSALITTGFSNNGIVVVQSAANASATVYYVDQTVAAGVTSVDTLVQSGHATLIGTLSSVTGDMTYTEFLVV